MDPAITNQDLIAPLLKWFGLENDYELRVMKPNQSLAGLTVDATKIAPDVRTQRGRAYRKQLYGSQSAGAPSLLPVPRGEGARSAD